MPDLLPSRTCASGGRTMTWRKAWSRSWDEVRYCSQAWRRRKARAVDPSHVRGPVRVRRPR